MCKIYTEYHGKSEIEHGLCACQVDLCACKVDNPVVKARGLSLRTGAQTMRYLSHGLSANVLVQSEETVIFVSGSWDFLLCRTEV